MKSFEYQFVEYELLDDNLGKIYHTSNPGEHFKKIIYINNSSLTVLLYCDETKDKKLIAQNLYHLFVTYKQYINILCPALTHVYIKDNMVYGYKTTFGSKITDGQFRNYMRNNKDFLIDFLHKSNYYYNDLKTFNFIKLKDGSISLIDLDSFRYVYPLQIPNFCYIPKHNFNIIKYYVKETTIISKCGKYKHCSKIYDIW